MAENPDIKIVTQTKLNLPSNEFLHRKVGPNPNFWSEKKQRYTSAIFKDSKGMSVDRGNGRSDDVIKSNFIGRFGVGAKGVQAIFKFSVQTCADLSLFVKDAPLEDNSLHMEVHSSASTVQLTSKQAKALFNKSVCWLDRKKY